MGEIIQFHLVKGVDLERCRFFYGDGIEFDRQDSLNAMRLLSYCCAEKHAPNMVITLENDQINKFLAEKNYLIRVAHFSSMDAMETRLAEIGDDLIMYVLLVGPNRPVNSFPIPTDRASLVCLKVVEDFDKAVQVVLFY